MVGCPHVTSVIPWEEDHNGVDVGHNLRARVHVDSDNATIPLHSMTVRQILSSMNSCTQK